MNEQYQTIEPTIGHRLFYLDALRVFAVFSMILLHVAATPLYREPIDGFNWQVCNVYDSLVRFCVPVFVMISGSIFLSPQKNITIKLIFTKYIVRICTAFIFWSLVYASLAGGGLRSFVLNFINGHFHMWFLFIIFGLYVTTPLVRKIMDEKKLIEYFLILGFIFALTLPFVDSFLEGNPIKRFFSAKTHINLVLGFQFYYVAGYYLGHYDVPKRYRIIIYHVALLSVIFTIVCTSYVSLKANELVGVFYNNLYPTTAFVAMALFLAFKNMCWKPSVKTTLFISALAKLSFGIYLVHVLTLRFIGLSATSFNPVFSVPLIALLTFTLSALIVHVMSKIPILNKYII